MNEQTPQHNSNAHDRGLTLFSKLSKFIIIFPIVIVALVIFAKLSNPESFRTNRNTPSIIPTVQPKQDKVNDLLMPNQTKNASPSVEFNLKGPLVCTFSDEKSAAQVSVKDKQIYVELPSKEEQSRILVKGDCLYNWDEMKLTGKKMCGIGKYLTMFESFSKMGILNIDTLFTSLSQAQPSLALPDAKSISKTCIKQEIKDEVFTIPTNILFTEEPLKAPAN